MNSLDMGFLNKDPGRTTYAGWTAFVKASTIHDSEETLRRATRDVK